MFSDCKTLTSFQHVCVAWPSPPLAAILLGSLCSCRGPGKQKTKGTPRSSALVFLLSSMLHLRPPEFLHSDCCDSHDQLSVCARVTSLFMRPQVAEYMQDGISTVVVGQGARGVSSSPGHAVSRSGVASCTTSGG